MIFIIKHTNLVLVQQSLVHDVVEVCKEVCVWGNILPSLHDPADEFVGMKLPLLITLRQHGGLKQDRGQKQSVHINRFVFPHCVMNGFHLYLIWEFKDDEF